MAEKRSTMSMLGNILADADSTHDIGDSTNFFKDAYLDRIFLSANNFMYFSTNSINMDVDDSLYVRAKAVNTKYIRLIPGQSVNQIIATTTNIRFGNGLEPSSDSSKDLGTSSLFWKDAYIDKLFLNATATLDGSVADGLVLKAHTNVGVRVVGTSLRVYDNNSSFGFSLKIISDDVLFAQLGGSSGNIICGAAAVIPQSDSNTDLGSSSKFWANAYIDKLFTKDGTDNRYALMMGGA